MHHYEAHKKVHEMDQTGKRVATRMAEVGFVRSTSLSNMMLKTARMRHSGISP
jgi:hypothetical protein